MYVLVISSKDLGIGVIRLLIDRLRLPQYQISNDGILNISAKKLSSSASVLPPNIPSNWKESRSPLNNGGSNPP